MTWMHGNWPRFLSAAITLGALMTVTPTVRAQGFGPDPFRPYNSQYDPYVYPMGPAGPGAGQSAAMNGGGIRGANQYQNFLNELQGPAISNGARYGIGQPYYQSTVDPNYIKYYRPPYQPRQKAERSFEETQRLINEKYFAYFAEKDPKKRAQLLKDAYRARSLATRALSTRREDPTRMLESATRPDSDPRSTATGRSTERSSSGGSTARSGIPASPRLRSGVIDSSRGSSSRSLPPSPALPFGTSTRTGAQRSPTDVLKRANSLDRPTDGQSKPAAKGARDTRSNAVPAAPSPSLTND